MKTITIRNPKLEERFAARCHGQGCNIADEIREARRRRFLSEGREFEERLAEIPFVAADGWLLTIGEIIQSARLERRRQELEMNPPIKGRP
jgi:hypothetical protein